MIKSVTYSFKAKKRLEYAEETEEKSKSEAQNNDSISSQAAMGSFQFGLDRTQQVSYAYSFEALLKKKGNGSGFLNQSVTNEPFGSLDQSGLITEPQVAGQTTIDGPDSLVFQPTSLTIETTRPNFKFWKRWARGENLGQTTGLEMETLKKRHGGALPEGSRKQNRVDDEDSCAGPDVSAETAKQSRREP